MTELASPVAMAGFGGINSFDSSRVGRLLAGFPPSPCGRPSRRSGPLGVRVFYSAAPRWMPRRQDVRRGFDSGDWWYPGATGADRGSPGHWRPGASSGESATSGMPFSTPHGSSSNFSIPPPLSRPLRCGAPAGWGWGRRRGAASGSRGERTGTANQDRFEGRRDRRGKSSRRWRSTSWCGRAWGIRARHRAPTLPRRDVGQHRADPVPVHLTGTLTARLPRPRCRDIRFWADAIPCAAIAAAKAADRDVREPTKRPHLGRDRNLQRGTRSVRRLRTGTERGGMA